MPAQKHLDSPASNRIKQLEISKISIDELEPYKNSPRYHAPAQIEKIIKSVNSFGVLMPLLVDGKMCVIDGHGRLEAAKEMGLPQVPVIKVDSLNEAEVKALRIALNRIAEDAEWNPEKLKVEFAAVLEAIPDFHLEVTGFDAPEIDLTLSLGEEPEPEKVELPPDDARVVTKFGDIWVLGDHLILCGDSRETHSYKKLLRGAKADLIITDPPYNVAIQGHVGNSGSVKHAEFAMASGEMTDDEFVAFLNVTLAQMKAQLHDGGMMYVFMDWRHIEELIRVGKGNGLNLLNMIVWVKNNGGMGSLYRSRHEMIAVFKNGNSPHTNNVQLGKYGRYRTNVWEYPGVNTFRKGRMDELTMHPTVKPVAMIKEAIMDVTKRGDIVLDPFGGSGTTLIAADSVGRLARLIEYEPLYCDVTVRRWQQEKGSEAFLFGSDMTFNEMAAFRHNRDGGDQ